MSKPGAYPSSGISLEDVLRPTKRHPACRRREAQPGSCMERENLCGDAKSPGNAIRCNSTPRLATAEGQSNPHSIVASDCITSLGMVGKRRPIVVPTLSRAGRDATEETPY